MSQEAVQTEFLNQRARFIDFLIKNDMFKTLALLGLCRLDTREIPAPALISMRPGQPPTIVVHPKMVLAKRQDWINFIFMHELRHIPQVVTDSIAHSYAEYPAWCDTEEKRINLFKSVENRAMDMALHEDLQKLFPEGRQIGKELAAYYFGDASADACFVPDDGSMLRDKDFTYYASELMKKMKEGDAPLSAMDLHDMMESLSPEEKQRLKEEIRETMRRAEEAGKVTANAAGRSAGNQDILLPVDPLRDSVKAALESIRVTANRIAKGVQGVCYSWDQKNKIWPLSSVPGVRSHVTHTAGCVLVCDVSGSMCSPAILGQLWTAFQTLKKRQHIVEAYACDTELSPFSKTVTGGGGTMLGASHVEEIRKKLKIKRGAPLDIIYLTDEQVDLQEILSMKDVRLHVINVAK